MAYSFMIPMLPTSSPHEIGSQGIQIDLRANGHVHSDKRKATNSNFGKLFAIGFTDGFRAALFLNRRDRWG